MNLSEQLTNERTSWRSVSFVSFKKDLIFLHVHDVCVCAYDSDKHVMEEVGQFFTWVDTEVKKMLAAINALIGETSESSLPGSSMRESNQKTLLYCLQVLLPTITTLCHQFQAGSAPGKGKFQWHALPGNSDILNKIWFCLCTSSCCYSPFHFPPEILVQTKEANV